MPVVLRANAELVAVAWIKTVTGIDASLVATTLPGPDPSGNYAWAASGFVQVGPVSGGSPQLHYALREPVVQVDCWAVNPNSGKPPWGKAANLAEAILAATYATAQMQATLTLPSSYPQARMLTAHFVQEPRRMPGDDSSYARYSGDLQCHWIELP